LIILHNIELKLVDHQAVALESLSCITALLFRFKSNPTISGEEKEIVLIGKLREIHKK